MQSLPRRMLLLTLPLLALTGCVQASQKPALMPSLVGQDVQSATRQLSMLSQPVEPIMVDVTKASTGVNRKIAHSEEWVVCEQSLKPGASVTSATEVTLKYAFVQKECETKKVELAQASQEHVATLPPLTPSASQPAPTYGPISEYTPAPSSASPSGSSTPNPLQIFDNCGDLRRVYPHGVARSGGRDDVNPSADFPINDEAYGRNKLLDVDRDGVACEDGQPAHA